MSEQDIRAEILDDLITCPHREVESLINSHIEMREKDSDFYTHLAIWAQDNTSIRDHKDLFIANLFLSNDPKHREAGFVLLQDLPPYRINHIIDNIKGKTVFSKNGKRYEKRFGSNLPRIFRSAVKYYLESRENDRDWFDACAIRARKDLKSIYCRCQIKPGNDHVRAVLFEDKELDKDSKFFKFKELAKESDPLKQADIILKNKIPFPIAIGCLNRLYPETFIALINNMTSQELLVNVNNLKRKGAFNHAEVKKIIDEKIEKATSDKNVDTLKAFQAANNVKDLSEEVKKSLSDISEQKILEFEVKKSTAMFIDKSGSMTLAIEAAKHIGSVIAPICRKDFFCYLFDAHPFRIKGEPKTLQEWNEALKNTYAGGSTAIGAPLKSMIKNNEVVEQIIIISDFQETSSPYFLIEYDKYCEKFKEKPNLVLVNIQGSWGSSLNNFTARLKEKSIEYNTYNIKSNVDYYSLPTLLQYLSRPDKFELIQEIMETKIPEKKDVKNNR
ncbi:MAG: hypothetical protein ACOCV1_00620 [Bacillota bacterium]